ncbi:MAG: GTPase [Candidatus Woesebacteria bacterium]|nr:GTPase [Candidatus Woesebacteria bacterium]
MVDITKQIEEIEAVLRKTPHHKATNGFIGAMRAKISRLKDKMEWSPSTGSGSSSGYSVKKQGDATLVLIGPPSAGKSTLINCITNAESKVAAYAFTTVSVIPGMLKYREAYIQILDVPGLIEGASIGKGRGKEVLSVARGSDLLVIMTDPERLKFFDQILLELEKAGIRINKKKPNVRIEKEISGGLTIISNIKQDFELKTIKEIAKEFGVKNGRIVLKEKVTMDQIIDSFSQRIVYKNAIFVVNKSDTLIGDRYDDLIYISASKKEGIEEFKEIVWQKLKLITIYLVEKNDKPSQKNPVIRQENDTLIDVAKSIGTEFYQSTTLAKIWGNGAKFDGQEMALSTKVIDGMQIRFI